MTETNLCRLSDRGVLRISGEDATSFFQGLITNDIAKLDTAGALYTALLTPQGKILFDFFLVRVEDGSADASFLIDCASAHAADLAKRLTFYRLRAAVEVENLSETHGVIADWGDADAPEVEGAVVYADPRVSEIGRRIIAPVDTLADFAPAPDSPGGAEDRYHALRISCGLPDSIRDIGSGEMFPHECNLDQLGAVDFKKGCYVGQEVVSRTEHRGTARKRVLPIRTDGAAPVSGDTISADGKPVGTVLSESGGHALAIVRLDRAGSALEGGHVLEASGGTVHLLRPAWVHYDVPGA